MIIFSSDSDHRVIPGVARKNLSGQQLKHEPWDSRCSCPRLSPSCVGSKSTF